MSNNRRYDIAIIIALSEEFDELHSQVKASTVVVEGEYFYSFEKSGYSCIVSLVKEMGPTPTALMAEKILSNFEPKNIVNIGIAAGADSDLKLGDVVVAKVVDSYMENTKAISKDDESSLFLHAGEQFRLTKSVLNHIENLRYSFSNLYIKWEKQCQTRCFQNSSESKEEECKPKVMFGPIASGSIVSASKTFTSWIIEKNRKFLAIEMESGGLRQACERGDTDILVIKAISDMGDENKKALDNHNNGSYRKLAMQNAVAFFFAILESGVLNRLDIDEKPGASNQEQAATREIFVTGNGTGSIINQNGSGTALEIQNKGSGPGERIVVQGSGIGEVINSSGPGTAKKISSGSTGSEIKVEVSQPVNTVVGMNVESTSAVCKQCGHTFLFNRIIQGFAGTNLPNLIIECPKCKAKWQQST